MQLDRWDFGDLRAPYWKIYWNNSEGASIHLNDKHLSLSPEQITLIPPETPFSGELRKPTIHFYVHFLTSLKWKDHKPIQLSATKEEQTYLKKLINTNVADVPPWEIMNIATQRLNQLPPDGWITSTTPSQRILEAIETINIRATNPPSMSELSNAAGMNPNAFIRRFKAETGSTPAHYALERKIDASCLLLHHSTQTIEEIASNCGFCDRFHFSRTFKRLRQITPAAFRKQIRIESKSSA
jgi:AraC-like DNA-binding protein